MIDPQIVLGIAGLILLAAIVAVLRVADPDAGLPAADPLDWTGANRHGVTGPACKGRVAN